MKSTEPSLNNYREEQKETSTTSGKTEPFFCSKVVKHSKNIILKTRLDTLIKRAGLSQSEFYNKMQISRQLWYFYSWGIWIIPTHMRVKLAEILQCDSSVIFQEENNAT